MKENESIWEDIKAATKEVTKDWTKHVTEHREKGKHDPKCIYCRDSKKAKASKTL